MSQNNSETFPEKISIESQELQLKGTGTRVKMWMDMYTLGLFIVDRNQNATAIVTNNKTAVIRLSIISGLITAEKMENAIREGFEKSTQGKTKAIQTEIDLFLNVFKQGVEKRDVFQFTYHPESGTTISKNGKVLSHIKGYELKKALWGIWLGENPVDKRLKDELLKD